MHWQTVGAAGVTFIDQAERAPGWYWMVRPLNTGPRSCDPDRPVLLPILVSADGVVSSPLSDLTALRADDLVLVDDARGQRFQSWFCGPIAPGAPSGQLARSPDGTVEGTPPAPGWSWCRTTVGLQHVDADGIGPIYVVDRGEEGLWVYPAAFADGRPCDVFELGFAEPLVSAGGVIDASGTLGRHRAEFFGAIAAPPPLPADFPAERA